MSSVDSIFSFPALAQVAPEDFSRATELLQRRAGIVLGSHKREMAERTLGTRAKALGMESVAEYLAHLDRSADAAEWQEFINAFTINHTAFFREQHHFTILARFAKGRARPLAIWSAACSTGEEPYSIAIALREGLPNPDHQISILATDIDTQAVAAAKAGVYTLDRVKPVAEAQLRKYFQRGTGSRAGMARVKPNIRDMVDFDVLNLLAPVWPLEQKFDVIFCRNTLIYFNKATQTKVLERFARVLKPGGLLFAGHSENLTYLTDAFRLKGQTVYEVTS